MALAFAPPASASINQQFHAGDSPAVVQEIVDTVSQIAVEYPEVRNVTVTSQPFGALPAYAYAENGEIVFNEEFTTNPRLLHSMLAADVVAGFHPRFGHCSPTEFLATHESAHIIDVAHGRITRIMLGVALGNGNWLRDTLPGYSFVPGGLNSGEAIAEAFASVRCNGGNATERHIHDLLVGI